MRSVPLNTQQVNVTQLLLTRRRFVPVTGETSEKLEDEDLDKAILAILFNLPRCRPDIDGSVDGIQFDQQNLRWVKSSTSPRFSHTRSTVTILSLLRQKQAKSS